ncbi:MAG: hypothetical protein KF798_06650 [Candidatus Paracaedibacteraceae bacterium]|nr:hypothetical protein [Candidatus Paracaedibacteraceae bacterium]
MRQGVFAVCGCPIQALLTCSCFSGMFAGYRYRQGGDALQERAQVCPRKAGVDLVRHCHAYPPY